MTIAETRCAEIALAGEIGDGDRHRLELAAGADPQGELRRRGQRAGEERGDEDERGRDERA